jgi:hypothetical protein
MATLLAQPFESIAVGDSWLPMPTDRILPRCGKVSSRVRYAPRDMTAVTRDSPSLTFGIADIGSLQFSQQRALRTGKKRQVPER